MPESLVLTVEISHKVLRAFRQVQYRFQIDDLRTCGRNIVECLRQKFEDSTIAFNLLRRNFGFLRSHILYLRIVLVLPDGLFAMAVPIFPQS